MLYKRKSALSAEEQANIVRGEAVKQGAVLLENQEGDVKSKLLKDIKSGKVESVMVLDKDHSDIAPAEIESPSSDFKITMLQ